MPRLQLLHVVMVTWKMLVYDAKLEVRASEWGFTVMVHLIVELRH